MNLTTKRRFAVTAMLDPAMQHCSDPVTLAEISQRQKISVSNLEQLFEKMRCRALVISVRGPGGGYRLAKDMVRVLVADIIAAVDEPIDSTRSGGKGSCHDDIKYITHDPWAKLNEHIVDYLGAATLKQLVDDQKAKQNGVAQVQDMRETLPKRERTTVAV